MRWRGGGAAKTRNVLIAAYADGAVRHWHVPSQKTLAVARCPDQVYALDARPDGEQYATGGKDKTVRLHDDGSGAVLVTMRPGGFDTVGHSNRVFGVKYAPEDGNLLVSGGWDNTVILWDVRTGSSVGSLFGPHVCGDSLDMHGHMILTGSWRPEKQLQLWDVRYARRNEPVADIPWSAMPAGSGASMALASRMASRGAPALLYAAQFSASGAFIAAGGSGSNEAKVFDASGTLVAAAALDATAPPSPCADGVSAGAGHAEAGAAGKSSRNLLGDAAVAPPTPALPPPGLFGTIAGLSRAVYSVAFDGDATLAVSGGDFLLIFDVNAAGGGAGAGAGGGVAAVGSGGGAGDDHGAC